MPKFARLTIRRAVADASSLMILARCSYPQMCNFCTAAMWAGVPAGAILVGVMALVVNMKSVPFEKRIAG